MKLKIGNFARICQVSVVTLRHYDDAGLLKPAHVDGWTGYRYYDMDQIKALNRILALKELGLSLEQIKKIVREELPLEEMRGMLRLKRAELEQQDRLIQDQLMRVDARMQQIEWEGHMPEYDVIMKRVEPVRGAILHDTVHRDDMKGPSTDGAYIYLFDEVGAYLRSYGLTEADVTGPTIDVWYDAPDNLPEEMRIAVVVPTNRAVPSSDRIVMGELPAVEQMVSVVHHGSFQTISPAYVAAFKWMEQNGYTLSGPSRGLYLQHQRGGDPNDYITELQFPVTKT
jgi:DNA-binding transcriptional MerR regulator/effector-binding domain-containing protein